MTQDCRRPWLAPRCPLAAPWLFHSYLPAPAWALGDGALALQSESGTADPRQITRGENLRRAEH